MSLLSHPSSSSSSWLTSLHTINFPPQSQYFLTSEVLRLMSLRAQPFFDRTLTWTFVYGGAAVVIQLLYFAVVSCEQYSLLWSFKKSLLL